MKTYYIFIIIALPNLLFGQNPLEVNRTEYLYEVNPNDTAQKILTNIYIQDSCGNEIEYTDFQYSHYLPFEEQIANERIIENKGYRNYAYELNCKQIEVKVLDGNKDLLKVFLNKYDKNGNELEFKVIDAKKNQVSLRQFEYNDENKLVKSIYYYKEDSVPSITMFTYKNDQLHNEFSINNYGDTLISNYLYDINGNLIMSEWPNNNFSDKDYELSVYKNGRKIKELYIKSESGDIDEYRMTYYENGLERTWSEYDFISGEIVRMSLSRYEFNK